MNQASVWCWSHRIGEQREIQSELRYMYVGQTGERGPGETEKRTCHMKPSGKLPEPSFGPHLVKSLQRVGQHQGAQRVINTSVDA